MNCTPLYTAIQSLYWIAYCMMFNYAASYLQDKGFSNSRIGLVLGACYALSALTQPTFASIVEKKRVPLAKGIRLVCCVTAALSLMLLIPGIGMLTPILFTLALMLHNAMQSSVNALSYALTAAGGRIRFGFARGMGSAMFAVSALVIGQLLKVMPSALLPALYAAALLALIFFLSRACRIHAPNAQEQVEKRGRALEPLRYAPFALFLLGVVLLFIAHIFIDNFMLKIMQNAGGGNAQLGIAISVAAATELPAMMLYGRLRKRFSCPALLGCAGCVWALKHLLILLAKTPTAICLCELLQFGSYAFYVPAGIEFAAVALPDRLLLRGQALIGTAFALGCLPATLIGGSLLDAIGLRATLTLFVLLSVAGAALFVLAGVLSKKSRPSA